MSNQPSLDNSKRLVDDAFQEYSSWATNGDKYMVAGRTCPSLPSGRYCLAQTTNGIIFVSQHMKCDEMISEGNSQMEEVLGEVERFWHLRERFDEKGFCYKRGILMWGKHGCGKTAIVNMAAQGIVGDGGIALTCNLPPSFVRQALQDFRQVEPERKLLCIWEDIESKACTNWGTEENALLSILDGDLQIDNVVHLATTNFPERLNERIRKRPRRFNKVIEIKPPDATMREKYFRFKFDFDDDEIKKWINSTEGLTFGSLAEAVISVTCLGINFEDTIHRLKSLECDNYSSDDYSEKKVGF